MYWVKSFVASAVCYKTVTRLNTSLYLDLYHVSIVVVHVL